jgi:hypothetical protein
MNRSIAVAASVLVLSACVHERILEPAPGAQLAPGKRDVAEVAVSGVTVKATGDSWKGDPEDLGKLFTSVRVTIDNHSGKPLSVSYLDFSLSGASGSHYTAVAPRDASGWLSLHLTQPSPPVQLAAWHGGEHAAGGHEGGFERGGFERGWGRDPFLYPGIDLYSGIDPWMGGGFYARPPEHLPTPDMLSQALPEGVVPDGDKTTGFIYFPNVTKRESAVELDMTLFDATNGQAFGHLAIPFETARLP